MIKWYQIGFKISQIYYVHNVLCSELKSKLNCLLQQPVSCLWWIFLHVRTSCLWGNLDCSNHSSIFFTWLHRFEMLHHTAWPKLCEKQDNSSVSLQTHQGELWLLVALTPHLHTLFWRGVSRMPQSFKGLKSNFSPCNPGAFQTSHAVYWHMTKKFNPFSSLCLQDCNSPQSLVVIPPERREQTEPRREGAPAFHHSLNL